MRTLGHLAQHRVHSRLPLTAAATSGSACAGRGGAPVPPSCSQRTSAAMAHSDEQEGELDALVVPRVVAFDLDGTLWLPEMDTLWGGAPFKPGKAPGQVVDSRGETVHLIGASLEVLQHIATDPAWQGVEVAYVSRTTEVDTAVACLRAMEVVPGRSMFDLGTHLEIFPGRKTTHFRNIQARSRGVPFEEMLFFDNERRNIIDTAPLGVAAIYCPDGLTSKVWQQGLATFASAAHRGQQQGGAKGARGTLAAVERH